MKAFSLLVGLLLLVGTIGCTPKAEPVPESPTVNVEQGEEIDPSTISEEDETTDKPTEGTTTEESGDGSTDEAATTEESGN